MIELHDVSKLYGAGVSRTYALKGVNLTIEAGEFVAVMGPSGSGKSTLMNILGGLDRPSTGSYLFAGEPVESKGDKELARLRGSMIGFVFQSFNLIPRLTVFGNVELPMVYARSGSPTRYDKVMESLKSVGLEGKAYRRPDQLSGGEIQRVAIARALVNDPEIILADEPTGNLDSKTGRGILEKLADLNRGGRTIILVTHNSEIAGYARRRLSIVDGVLKEVG